MPRTARKPKAAAAIQAKPLYALAPWSCVHRPDGSKIEAYVEITGDWETIAHVPEAKGINAEATAGFIVKAVNDYDRHRQIIAELITALELCMECEDLTWEAEQEAELVLRRVRQGT